MFQRSVQIDAAAKKIIVERAIEGGNEVIEAKLPAVVSVIKGYQRTETSEPHGHQKSRQN